MSVAWTASRLFGRTLAILAMAPALWGGSWSVEHVAGTSLADSSLALDSLGQPVIAYSDGHLRLARWSGLSWHVENIGPACARDVSLALDRADKPAIGYYDESVGALQYARWTDEASLRRARILMDYRIGNFMSLTLAQLDAFLAAADRDP